MSQYANLNVHRSEAYVKPAYLKMYKVTFHVSGINGKGNLRIDINKSKKTI